KAYAHLTSSIDQWPREPRRLLRGRQRGFDRLRLGRGDKGTRQGRRSGPREGDAVGQTARREGRANCPAVEALKDMGYDYLIVEMPMEVPEDFTWPLSSVSSDY
ncbi:MAG: hypothetical protein QW057_06510, partial [Candidatus Bathyarchaeia archaeon]